jgi:hypothetical protein
MEKFEVDDNPWASSLPKLVAFPLKDYHRTIARTAGEVGGTCP